MKKLLAVVATIGMMVSLNVTAASNFAESSHWKSGWAQGADEYAAASKDDSTYVLISCDDTEPTELWFGMFTNANDQPVAGKVSVTIDGKTYDNPFAASTYGSPEEYQRFWDTLRNAKELSITVGNTTKAFTTADLSKALPAYNTPDFSCKLGF